jgi:predicted DNA-binding WGR domain protein
MTGWRPEPNSGVRNTFITNMNRSVATDSKLSLDADRRISDSTEMIKQPYHLYVERTDATRNMARYYAMEISITLFGEACLTRSWGRIGRSGKRMTHHFKREEEAVDLFLDLLRQKRARGYRPAGPDIGENRARKQKID